MKFGIFGAGSIGCYVGGMLAANGEAVTLVGRETMGRSLASGLHLTRHDGLERHVAAGGLEFASDPAGLAACDTIFVCVKGGDTAEAARQLATVARQEAVIVSLQNGVSNAARLREILTGRTVLAAMVPFNVARIGENRFHCGTQGKILVEDAGAAGAIAARLRLAGIPAATSGGIEAVLWGKLLLNLNNAVNVLSGLPLKAQLSDRRYRRVLALSVAEALRVLTAAGIRPAKIGRVRPQIIPWVLRLPDWLFRIAAAGMLKVDDQARSSMADDLAAGRQPEIGYLNGEIVGLGEKTGVPTPVNARLVALVNKSFAEGRTPALSGPDLLARVSR